eukprot:3934776-Rhodomonas_salina.1
MGTRTTQDQPGKPFLLSAPHVRTAHRVHCRLKYKKPRVWYNLYCYFGFLYLISGCSSMPSLRTAATRSPVLAYISQ